MPQNKIETGFQLIEDAMELLQQALQTSLLDTYIENGENINDDYRVRVIENQPDNQTKMTIEQIYSKLQGLELTPEEKRKVSQLVLLKGMMKEPVQPNHQLTPDALGFLFVYLVEQLAKKDHKQLLINDLTIGTGNLLLTVVLNLEIAGYDVTGTGVEVDDTLLAVAAVNLQWTGASVQLYHQDSLQHLLVEPGDFAIADLPIGYYPDDQQAKQFVVGVKEGHTYAHHLLMEQSMKYVKEDGFGIFLVPEDFLETEQAPALKEWLASQVYLQAVLRLPVSMFKEKKSRKTIVVVQNRGEHARQAKEVLVADLPSLKEAEAIQTFFNQFTQWKVENLNTI